MKERLLEAKKIQVWCELCKKKIWIRAKNIEEVIREALWHKKGYCCKAKQTQKKLSIS